MDSQLLEAVGAGFLFLEKAPDKGLEKQVFGVFREVLSFVEYRNNEKKEIQGEVVFTTKDLIDNKSQSGMEDYFRESDKKRNLLNSLVKELEERSSRLNNFSRDNGFKFYPSLTIESEGGGAGNTKTYKFLSLSISEKEGDELIDIPPSFFRYRIETNSKLLWLEKIIDGLYVKGWRWWFYILLVMGGIVGSILSIYLSFLVAIKSNDILVFFKSILFGFSIFLAIYYTFSPLYFLVINRLIIFPKVFGGYKTKLIIYKKPEEKRRRGGNYGKINVVYVTAECPICNESIEMDQIFWKWRWRIVGRCDHNPTEHIFSFDYKTMAGTPIFSEYKELLKNKKK